MNENYTDFRFPVIKANPWTKVFSPFTPADAINLISHLLCYTPSQRYSPFEAMAHEVILIHCVSSSSLCLISFSL